MLRKMFERIDHAGRCALSGRGFAYGPPTAEYTHTLMGNFYFQLQQIALSVRWDSDGSGRDFVLKVGPVGLHGTIGRRALVAENPIEDHESTLKVRKVGKLGELSTWRNWRHVGVCFEWCLPLRMVRVEVGPFGAAILDGGW